MRVSTDFGTGSAGIGMFLLRLLEPKPRLFFDFDALAQQTNPAVDRPTAAVSVA
jgi:hypothetical protein